MAEQGKPIDDLTRKRIMADYFETESYSETARKFNVSPQTVLNYISKDKEFGRVLKEKKEKENKTVLEEMEKMTEKKINILKLAMDEMERLLQEKKVTPNSLATIYGVLLDKELKNKEINLKDKETKTENIQRVEIVNTLSRDDEDGND